GWDRHGLISDYSKVTPAGYKDPYGLDVPINSFAEYYYTTWWKGAMIESGETAAPPMRLSGYGRINDGTANPEDFHGSVIVVDPLGQGDGKTVQEGVDKARPGDTVFVRPGTYKETVRLGKGIRLWGQNPYTTIIDSENKGSSITAANNCDISGFTLTGTGFDYSSDRFRAAIHAVDCDSTLIIRGNIFFSNSVFGVLVESSRFDGYNTTSADRYIAPENALDTIAYKGYSNPRIIGNTFYNIGERAVYCIHAAPEIANNIFMGNLKTLGMTQLSKPFIHHNVFYRNNVSININRSAPIICRNIMIGNYWGQRVMEGSLPVIHDNLTWNSPYYKEFAEDGNYIKYFPVPGNGEIEVDPRFVNMNGGDFRFAPDSPFAGKNKKYDHYGIIEGPGIQVPPTIECEYSWAEEFLHRTDETRAVIAAIDSVNARIKTLNLSYTITYRSFMYSEYDSSGNQAAFELKDKPVSGFDYVAKSWRWNDGKREKIYSCSFFGGGKTLSDLGTVNFDGRRVHALSGRFAYPGPESDTHAIGEPPCRENIGGLYLDYDQYINGSIGPAGTFYYGYLRILGGEVLKEREMIDGRECLVVRYPHLGQDQVYKFYLDPKLGYRPIKLEQYFDRKLYRRIDNYRYAPAGGVWLPVSVRITDYAVKKPAEGRVIGITVMRVTPETLVFNGQQVDVTNYLPSALNFEEYAKTGTYIPPVKKTRKKKEDM
ncbi:MAG: NosD domain-containing protein, partial [Candidatus Latescibacterota bacterium]